MRQLISLKRLVDDIEDTGLDLSQVFMDRDDIVEVESDDDDADDD